MIVEASVEIHRSAEQVFAFVTDVAQYPRWQGACVSNRVTSPGGMGLGAIIEHTGRFLGRRYVSHATVREHDPPRRFMYEAIAMGIPFTLRYSIDPIAAGARLTLRSEAAAKGLAGLFQRLARRRVEAMFRRDADRLKAVIESLPA